MLPESQFARNHGTEIAQISWKNYGTQEEIQVDFCDVLFTLRHPRFIVQKKGAVP